LDEYTPRAIQKVVNKISSNYELRMKLVEKSNVLELDIQQVASELKKDSHRRSADDLSKEFHYRAELQNPEVGIFFSEVISDSDWGNKMIPVPSVEQNRTPTVILEAMNLSIESNLSEVSKVIKGARSYAVTDSGVIVNYYKGASKLFTDELTAYNLVRENEQLRDDDNWWSTNSIKYQIDSFYSLGFILKMIEKLRHKKILEVKQII